MYANTQASMRCRRPGHCCNVGFTPPQSGSEDTGRREVSFYLKGLCFGSGMAYYKGTVPHDSIYGFSSIEPVWTPVVWLKIFSICITILLSFSELLESSPVYCTVLYRFLKSKVRIIGRKLKENWKCFNPVLAGQNVIVDRLAKIIVCKNFVAMS